MPLLQTLLLLAWLFNPIMGKLAQSLCHDNIETQDTRGNRYCSPVSKSTFTDLATGGTYRDVISMDISTKTCLTQLVNYTDNVLAEEVSNSECCKTVDSASFIQLQPQDSSFY
jgi:hypothetical protein